MALNFQFASGALFKYSFLTKRVRFAGAGFYAGAGCGRGAAALEHSVFSATARYKSAVELTVASISSGRPASPFAGWRSRCRAEAA